MAEAADVELLHAISRRDPDALVALYDRYGRLAFGLAYRILGDPATAEEVVQDAFMRVWQRADSFDAERGSLRAWLLSIVHHRAIDQVRKRGIHPEDEALDPIAPRLGVSDVWGDVLATLEAEQVRRAVAELPGEQRQAIELAYFGGLTHSEIAQQTGIPLGTIKSRLRLGLRRLQQLLVADTGQAEKISGT
ncbi:MAG TPA: sigma-70 family RNA polymerase sigma factor [Thermomicrobiaceae bacterium]|nr:sigma-70 family RNA polymerase sigma factor [Thermomicrobiaceae bacterium]